MKVLTIVGARPQFIKCAPVSLALRSSGYVEYLVHTGQHYDRAMSDIFFEELGIPQPDINIGVGSGSHGKQTGEMLMKLEEVLLQEKPDWVLVYGDTNSTLAGALAAIKVHIPVTHIEAGLRSFNREMPEEHNRVLTDHCADLLLCPTQTAVANLAREGITQNVVNVGDTMYDAVLRFGETADTRSTALHDLSLDSGKYLLATVHRPYNTDDPQHLHSILAALAATGETVVFPIHPRTKARLINLRSSESVLKCERIRYIEPLGYLDMLQLEQHARMILTDSGGIQKEAYFFKVPCVTLRLETEWVETVEAGWNVLTGADSNRILDAVGHWQKPAVNPPSCFGDGNAAAQIVDALQRPRV